MKGAQANRQFQNLVKAYDRAADERDTFQAEDWKAELRQEYLAVLNKEKLTRLIDLGAGTGLHARYFQEQGLQVTCLDLSPAHVEKCRQKGLDARVGNLLDLSGMEDGYDCAWALNSLLHIPLSLLPAALDGIAGILRPGGLFFWGQHGGEYREGVYEDDTHQPQRFFCLLTDDQILELARVSYRIEVFKTITPDPDSGLHFQALLLRSIKPAGPGGQS